MDSELFNSSVVALLNVFVHVFLQLQVPSKWLGVVKLSALLCSSWIASLGPTYPVNTRFKDVKVSDVFCLDAKRLTLSCVELLSPYRVIDLSVGCCTTVAVAAQIWELADNESDLSLILGVHEPIPTLFVCPVTNWFSVCTYVCRMDLGVCVVCLGERKCLTRFETYTLSSR